MPACDQADVEMFPLHLASQGTPDYAQDIYQHLRQLEATESHMYVRQSGQEE